MFKNNILRKKTLNTLLYVFDEFLWYLKSVPNINIFQCFGIKTEIVMFVFGCVPFSTRSCSLLFFCISSTFLASYRYRFIIDGGLKIVKGVRHNLKTHPRAMKISALTIFGVLSSKMKLLNRYNLWLISYKLYQNDGFLTL